MKSFKMTRNLDTGRSRTFSNCKIFFLDQQGLSLFIWFAIALLSIFALAQCTGVGKVGKWLLIESSTPLIKCNILAIIKFMLSMPREEESRDVMC